MIACYEFASVRVYCVLRVYACVQVCVYMFTCVYQYMCAYILLTCVYKCACMWCMCGDVWRILNNKPPQTALTHTTLKSSYSDRGHQTQPLGLVTRSLLVSLALPSNYMEPLFLLPGMVYVRVVHGCGLKGGASV